MKRSFFILIAVLFIFQNLSAQLSYGFKVGLNYSSIIGPSELDAAEMALEDDGFNVGFHVGGAINVRLTDVLGIRTEILFSQKGGEYIYDGPSYLRLVDFDNIDFVATGKRFIVQNTTNSYLDLPVMLTARLGKFKVSGGVNVGVLVSSIAEGEVRFTAQNASGATQGEIIAGINYNYGKDVAGESKLGEVNTVLIGARTVEFPTIIGAYYENQEEVTDNYFNAFDFGVNAGVSYFLNGALYIGARINYGLLDVTNNDLDFSLQSLDAGNFIKRDDFDQNISFQASVGFGF